MNLFDGEKNCIYKVKNICLELAVKRRLEILGMTENVDVLIVNKKSSAIIIKVRGTRFALGKKFAQGIEVGGVLN